MIIKNIGFLVQTDDAVNRNGMRRGREMGDLPVLQNAWLRTNGKRVEGYGTMSAYDQKDGEEVIDANGGAVLPAWCDSHTHLVFAASRESEFVDKIQGKTYAEIAAKGGGILNSAARLARMSEDALFDISLKRLKKAVSLGTGAIEIKSGYGLSLEGELKMLRVIKRLKQEDIIPIKATYLGAHAIPEAYKGRKEDYLKLVLEEILPEVAAHQLADYIDVFCEEGFFDRKDTEQVIRAGAGYGLKAKIHANQLNRSGGVQTGVALGALSVDHLETMGREEIDCLKDSNTLPVLLPGAAFFLRMGYPPARDLVNAGLPVVVASDYNPGSAPNYNMNLILSLSCIQMKMTPQEAISAQTINGAAAMELSDQVGSIAAGKLANLIITSPIPSLEFIPYSFGENLISRVIINGKIYEGTVA